MLYQGQIKTARRQPAGTGRRPEITGDLIKMETAILDQPVGFSSCLNPYGVHTFNFRDKFLKEKDF
jgi:hypothetical protein